MLPSLSLPKGGGALRGMGEKFSANPVTGTGSMSFPIHTSAGRADFGPQLSLAYDSGSGNGPFGFGWTLSLPTITRKTDKGLPRYLDAEESDVFLLSGSEDLVPVLKEDGSRFVETVDGHTVHRYRPRIEGLFARIERWTRHSDGDVHWRSFSRDNVLTLYGRDTNSRIADPNDPFRAFSWLICETRDDRGNVILYRYKAENGDGVNLSHACERNRGDRNDPRRTSNRYLKRILYGNQVPLLEDTGRRPRFLSEEQIQGAGWMFEVVFDYGEHDEHAPTPREVSPWAHRVDAFSSYRAGFEVRTARLCQRALMFHHFPDEPGVGADCLVRSTDLTYTHEQEPVNAKNPVYTFLRAVSQRGYRRDGAGWLARGLPPLEFVYSEPIVQDQVQDVDTESLANLPVGVDGTLWQWVDLHGEGIPGILTEQAGAWFYRRNVSPISQRPVELAPLEHVALKPNLSLSGGRAQFMDLAGDGRPDLVVLDSPEAGLYEHDDAEGWHPFRPFTSRLQRDLRDPNLRFVDLDGDGHADVLITEDDALVWHPSLAEAGFGSARRVQNALDEEEGPRLVFADGAQSIYLADMSGDGLTDLVRIRNGEVCYWPNLGHGRFGPKITMDRSPWLDHADQFEQRRVRLADIDGSGTTDLIYLHRDGVRLYFNQSGNAWSAPETLRAFPSVAEPVSVAVTDLLGNGTACLLWSSPLPGDVRHPMRFVDLMGGQKPHLLVGIRNNLGAETQVAYASSTRFYLQDKYAGRPWITNLPFPVHVVERVVTWDHVSKNRFVARYAYHHGHFDGEEREFRGFGMVEQWDTAELSALTEGEPLAPASNLDPASHVPPVLTKTWFHTGARLGPDLDVELFREPGTTGAQARAQRLEEAPLTRDLTADEEIEAARALKGSTLRQEVYALDGTEKARLPYIVTEQRSAVRLLQRRGDQRHAVFLAHAHEALTYHYEREPADPRVGHTLMLQVDGWGNVLQQASIGYGRRSPDPDLSPADRDQQTQTRITYTSSRFTSAVESQDSYRTPLPCESVTWELTGYPATGPAGRMRREDLVETIDGEIVHTFDGELAYEAVPTLGRLRRLLDHSRILFRPDALGPSLLPLGVLQSQALPGERYQLAYTPGLLSDVFRREGEPLLPAPDPLDGPGSDRGGYVDLDGDGRWWAPSGQTLLAPAGQDELAYARQHFFLPQRSRDPFHAESSVSWDDYDLLMIGAIDAIGNEISVDNDYRVLSPRGLTDENLNRTEVAFDTLGRVAGTASIGKPSEGLGDSLEGFVADLEEGVLDEPFAPHELLGQATTRIIYDPGVYARTGTEPAVVCALAREQHGPDTRIQQGFSYSDGFGREIQKKLQAEPDPDGAKRWVGSGWTIYNNKGKPVLQYEPFFTSDHRFERDLRAGVSPILFYDPVDRVVATLHPNHTWEKAVSGAWKQSAWDPHDTLLIDPREDEDIAGYVKGWFAARPGVWETWYAQRKTGALGPLQQAAAEKCETHAYTPAVTHLDTLGRPFLALAHAGFRDDGSPILLPTRTALDLSGQPREVRDALDRIVMRYDYDLLGRNIHQSSMEAGPRWVLSDAAGHPIRAWDGRGHQVRTEYDLLRRPLRSWVTGADPEDPLRELLTDRMVYGEQHAAAQQHNLRGELHLHFDQAGVVAVEAHDFQGNVLRTSRRLAREYTRSLDWSAVEPALEPLDLVALEATLAPRLEAETFTSHTTYDALNRPITLAPPHAPAMSPSVLRTAYDESGLLERVDVNLRGEQSDGEPVWTPFVTRIAHDAKGQRLRIDYGNGAHTRYEYDPLTFRLVYLLTARAGEDLQDLHYTYDAAGNITHLQDTAQQTIFFRNQRVEPSAEYTYDALYRLIEAHGREHLGQVGGVPIPHSHDDRQRTRIPWSHNDGQAMGTYVERYVYDAVGNLLEMKHRGDNPAHPGWTRAYTYAEASQIEGAKVNNRLSHTDVGDGPERHLYDAHGNMLRMPHLAGTHPIPNLHWDHRDQLRRADLPAGGTAWFVYDAAGERVRKVREPVPGRIEERIYLGGFELYRERDGEAEPTLVRETLHVLDDQQRIAIVETRTVGDDPGLSHVSRYQLSNHLGSSALELDEHGQIISYEEYTPYGSSAYQAVRSETETPKRYRYTGKERDEETGLNYHSARYYAPWLGRWTSCDPLGIAATINGMAYGRCNPVYFVDPEGTEDYGWPKGATFHAPDNTASRGTQAHKDILPELTHRINATGSVEAQNEVRTLPGGSKKSGSKHPGEIDLLLLLPGVWAKILELKPWGRGQKAKKETDHYSKHSPRPEPTTTNNLILNNRLLEPVTTAETTYLIQQNPKQRGLLEYYGFKAISPANPIVEYYPRRLDGTGGTRASADTASNLAAPATKPPPADAPTPPKRAPRPSKFGTLLSLPLVIQEARRIKSQWSTGDELGAANRAAGLLLYYTWAWPAALSIDAYDTYKSDPSIQARAQQSSKTKAIVLVPALVAKNMLVGLIQDYDDFFSNPAY